MPSGRKLIKEELDPKSKTNLIKYIDEYVAKVTAEKINFQLTISQISAKLLSESYKQRFPTLYAKYPAVYQALQAMSSKE
jgi:hypothetical protein